MLGDEPDASPGAWAGLPAWSRTCLLVWSIPAAVFVVLSVIGVLGPRDPGQGLWLLGSFVVVVALGAGATVLLGLRDALQARSLLPFLRNLLCAAGFALALGVLSLTVQALATQAKDGASPASHDAPWEVPPMDTSASGKGSSK